MSRSSFDASSSFRMCQMRPQIDTPSGGFNSPCRFRSAYESGSVTNTRNRGAMNPLCTASQPNDIFCRPNFDLVLSSQMLVVAPDSVTTHAHRGGDKGHVILIDSCHELFGFLPLRKHLVSRNDSDVGEQRVHHRNDFILREARSLRRDVQMLFRLVNRVLGNQEFVTGTEEDS